MKINFISWLIDIKEEIRTIFEITNNTYDRELSDAILRIFRSETLRTQLSEKELKQASKFSWRNTAKETVKVYNKVGSR